ncbi:CLUMA_CG018100, isoform A [Clunio marinus]|uniref:Phospholipase A2 n=1 Tax=Clunio marinus TaxID=568069 RepID=A0A1J1IZP7_9DIPT|nr:CLUMA_CG018100, isoform A [Clunio marinus]
MFSSNISDVNEHHREVRSKRDVFNLYSMIKCATGCDPLIYKGYGCYCGFLGSGRALDGIDRCCKAHDYCYNSANYYNVYGCKI